MDDYLITDEMVETAARAMDHAYNPERHPILAAMFRDYARTAIEAAPQIAAAALRDAADAWQRGEWSTITGPAKRPRQAPRILGIANAVTGWIRARADRIEREARNG